MSRNAAFVPGTVIELPPGTVIPPAAEADPSVVAIHEAPLPEPVSGNPADAPATTPATQNEAA
ncbi:MAG: hypothetical protein INR63_06700 [Actinomycetospora chiangmaiensis]|nr:hypothetical protein [Actinomycetospora chiangmaiensis]